MEKNLIISKAQQLKYRDDLLRLLNQMKEDEMGKNGASDKFFPFEMRQISYYCNPNHTYHRYKQFEIEKKSGGVRLITAPRYRSYKDILHYLNEILKAMYKPSKYAMGFTEDRSVVTNADVHKGQNYILNIDLKDFFPSIDQARVWKRLQLEPFNFNRAIANTIAGLCSMKLKQEDGTSRYVIPQGAPTSPIITNMICDKLDRRLGGLAKRFGLRYTRYADDITFSSMHNVYQKNSDFWIELMRIITSQGFQINEAKTRLQKRGARQEVTGIIVSDKLNVSQKYVRDIRNILYTWQEYGYNEASERFMTKYIKDKGHVKKDSVKMINVLKGKLNYMKMVKGAKDSVYIRLKNKFDILVAEQMQFTQNIESAEDIQKRLVETTPLLEFEIKNNTKVMIHNIPPIPYSTEKRDGNDRLNTFHNRDYSHKYAKFTIGGKTYFASVNNSLTNEHLAKKELLSITKYRYRNGKIYWFIDDINLNMELTELTNVDINDLNNLLDSILNSSYGQ